MKRKEKSLLYNDDWRIGLDVPMLSPHLIPEGMQQYFSNEKQRWFLTLCRGPLFSCKHKKKVDKPS